MNNNIKLEDYLSSLSPLASSNEDSESSNSSYSESSDSEDYDVMDACIYEDALIKTEGRYHYNKYERKSSPSIKVECTECAIQFVAHAKYREHMNSAHGVSQPYKCDLCPEAKETRYSKKK
eukprot:328830_1